MSKFDEAMEKYQTSMDEVIGQEYNTDLLTKVAKGLGPSIYLKDASLVSCSDQTELDRVKANFLLKKLGLEDNAALDAAIAEVCVAFGKARNKHRAVFYYLLVEKLGQQAFYA